MTGFARTARTVYLGMVGPLLLTLPTTIMVARGLGPADKGAWSIVLQGFFVTEMVASMGAAAYYIVRLGRDLSLEDALPTAVFQGFAMSSTIAVAGFVVGVTGLFTDAVSLSMAAVLAATLVALVVGRHLAHLAIGAGATRIYSQATLSQAAVQLVAIGVFQVATERLTLLAVAISFGLGALARVVVPAILLLRLATPRWGVRRDLWGDALRFGWRRALSEIEDALNTRLPLLLLSLFDPIAAVGVYSISLGLAEIMGQAGAALALAAMPGFATDAALRAHEYARRTVALSTMLALIVAPASITIPFVFGEGYADATTQLLLLLPTVPVLAVNRMLTSALSASDRVATVARSGTASLVCIALAGAVLTPLYSANGASAALLVGLLVQTALTARRLARDADLLMREVLVPRSNDFEVVLRQALRALPLGTTR